MAKDRKDIVYTLTKAGIASIPVVGGTASEILSLLITPPLEKRMDSWKMEVGLRLQKLEKNDNIDLNKLSENEVFIDTVLKITNEALKTSEREKLEYFKNAIINTAVETDPDISEINIFLRLITEFTVWHVKIFKLFDDPEKWYQVNEKEFSQYSMAPLSRILDKAYPELKSKKDFYNLIWSDLGRYGLHNTSDLNTGMSINGLKSSRTTNLGKKFLRFIEGQDKFYK